MELADRADTKLSEDRQGARCNIGVFLHHRFVRTKVLLTCDRKRCQNNSIADDLGIVKLDRTISLGIASILPRTKLEICRSEERRVGKECRSASPPGAYTSQSSGCRGCAHS